jgi:hypothetical protein
MYTVPVFPSPIYAKITKSLIDIGFTSLIEDFNATLLSRWGTIFETLLKA